MTIRLIPSFARVAIRWGGTVILVSVLAYFYQGYREGKWWDASYIASLGIPITFMPVAVWFMFVPRFLEYSETEITIVTRLGKYTYSWDDLYCYGVGNGVFKIKFSGDSQPCQIYSG